MKKDVEGKAYVGRNKDTDNKFSEVLTEDNFNKLVKELSVVKYQLLSYVNDLQDFREVLNGLGYNVESKKDFIETIKSLNIPTKEKNDKKNEARKVVNWL